MVFLCTQPMPLNVGRIQSVRAAQLREGIQVVSTQRPLKLPGSWKALKQVAKWKVNKLASWFSLVHRSISKPCVSHTETEKWPHVMSSHSSVFLISFPITWLPGPAALWFDSLGTCASAVSVSQVVRTETAWPRYSTRSDRSAQFTEPQHYLKTSYSSEYSNLCTKKKFLLNSDKRLFNGWNCQNWLLWSFFPSEAIKFLIIFLWFVTWKLQLILFFTKYTNWVSRFSFLSTYGSNPFS